MDDLISRQEAIKELREKAIALYGYDVTSVINCAIYKLQNLPSAEPERKSPCDVCENLENGDTLYVSSDWDGGIGFDYIRDIKFCPVCGRRLSDG